jgi:transcriptional activator SPT7
MRTPSMNDEAMSNGSGNNAADAGDNIGEEDPRQLEARDRFKRTEARILAALEDTTDADGAIPEDDDALAASGHSEDQPPASAPRKAARVIDEDDYGDDDGDDDDEEDAGNASPLKHKTTTPVNNLANLNPRLRIPHLPVKPTVERSNTTSSDQTRSSDDIRKKLEQERNAVEEAARLSSYTMFYTLENDRDAMLEQQKLDELDRQVENEMSGQEQNAHAENDPVNQPGTLGSQSLGGSIGLTMKYLISKIDAERSKVHASDAEIRQLMHDARKGRSKWASDDKIGQEELYESLESVLMRLKAVEHAAPFLQKVNKRDAPDYYQIIKHPMDIGTMMKKLRGYQYKNKQEFVDDLMLIWSNCLKYNSDPSHYLRKKALAMKKETEKLVPLIPDIVVRDRADVEAEERAKHADLDGLDDSDDEEPIMASRGRKAPAKKGKGTNAARKALPSDQEGTPGAESKPIVSGGLAAGSAHSAGGSNLKNEFLRADSDVPMEGLINGFATPPPGSLTPLAINGIIGSGAPPSQADMSELDVPGTAALGSFDDAELDDIEFRTWKQITKKDRATIAAQRHRMFRPDGSLNVDEPAILRSRASMRRWARKRKHAFEEQNLDPNLANAEANDAGQQAAPETLAQGIEEEQDLDLPDYYDPVCAVPDLNERLKWVEDSEGNLVDQSEENLHFVPKGYFMSPLSNFTKKMESNMKSMQETRKICSKIGVVKQMQLQTQVREKEKRRLLACCNDNIADVGVDVPESVPEI